MRFAACACLVALAGCGKSDADAPLSPRGEFRVKLGAYLAEARAGAKLLEARPTASEVDQKAQKVKDLYTRIPDVPEGMGDKRFFAVEFLAIDNGFAAGADYADRATGFLKLDRQYMKPEYRETARKFYDEDLPRAAQTIRKAADKLEELARK